MPQFRQHLSDLEAEHKRVSGAYDEMLAQHEATFMNVSRNMELGEERRLRDREMETRHPIKHARYSQQLSHQETRFGSGSCDKNKIFAHQENESESELGTPCSLLGQRQSGDESRAAKFCIIQVQVSDVMLSAGL